MHSFMANEIAISGNYLNIERRNGALHVSPGEPRNSRREDWYKSGDRRSRLLTQLTVGVARRGSVKAVQKHSKHTGSSPIFGTWKERAQPAKEWGASDPNAGAILSNAHRLRLAE